MVDANLTYLDSLNRYIVLWSYKALTGLSEKRLVSTKPCVYTLDKKSPFFFDDWINIRFKPCHTEEYLGGDESIT